MIDQDDKRPAYLAIDGFVATIVLNRAESYNVIDREMAVRLRHLAMEASRNDTVRAIVIRGEGAAFCAGGDIRHFLNNIDAIDDAIRELLTPYHEFLYTLRHTPKLVIASVHGSAAGAGLSLASMCDLCIASEDARFTPAYAKIGLSPDGGGTYGLARAIGARRAFQLFLAEDGVSAAQAAQWGLVNKLVPVGSLQEETLAYVERICRTSPEAIESTKRLLRESPTAHLHDHLIDEMESLIRCMGTGTFAAAIQRFIDKA